MAIFIFKKQKKKRFGSSSCRRFESIKIGDCTQRIGQRSLTNESHMLQCFTTARIHDERETGGSSAKGHQLFKGFRDDLIDIIIVVRVDDI